MTLEEYRQEHSNSPLALDEFAQLATGVTDDPELVNRAEEFLSAQEAFEAVLAARDVEMG